MALLIITIVIICLSLLLAYLSIQNDMKKTKHVEEVKKDLEKERVVFYAPAHKEQEEKKHQEK